MIETVYLFTLLTVFVLYYLYLRWTYKGPPHVKGLPLVGYAPFLGSEPYLKLHELVQKKGPIFSLYLGSLYVVVLGNYDVVHEAFVEKGHVFNGRPPHIVFKAYDHEKAFPFMDGEDWKVQRTFTMNTLRSLGFGRHYTKNYVQMEIQDFIKELKDYKGKTVKVKDTFPKSINALMLGLLTGKHYDRIDPNSWAARITDTVNVLVQMYIYDITGLFPWLLQLPFAKALGLRKNVRIMKDKLWSLIEEETRPLKASYSQSTEPDNFIHSWYSEQETRSKNNDPHKGLFSDFALINNLDILIQASTETTSTSLLWAFIYLVLHQDIQDKIHEEIDQHIGYNKAPALDDARNMHYTKAFLLEVHRRATIAPWGILHSNRVEGNLRGFQIPKDSVILCNFWSIHHDPNFFPDPLKFDPERFLDQERKFQPREYVSAFSFGRRICPGKQVAEMQLFLYLTSILQVFHLRLPPGSTLSDKDCGIERAALRRPPDYEVIFQVRNK